MDGTFIKNNGLNVYKVSSRPKGYVLLINIETFQHGTKQQRFGSKRDFDMLKEMWEQFGYRVKEYYNLKLKLVDKHSVILVRGSLDVQEFEHAVEDFVGMPELESVDSAIAFIMSHGKEDERNPHAILISTSDDRFISSDWIKNRFSAINCKALIDKPKVLFFQTCRGILQDHGVKFAQTNVMNSGLTIIENKLVPIISDMLIVYPTLPGYVSQRNTILGAMFVQECISVFKEDSPQMDLLTMLNKVDNVIRQKCGNNSVLFQVLYYESWGFNKKMYFQPTNKDGRKCKRKKNCDDIPNIPMLFH